MDGATFKKIINYYGEDNIIGLGFDNSSAITFGKGEFSLAKTYNEELECVQSVSFDLTGRPYHVIKHVECIQAILVRDSGVEDIDMYDRISTRP